MRLFTTITIIPQQQRMSNIIQLKAAVHKIALNWLQAMYEVDGLLFGINNILNSLNTADWETLNTDLLTWKDDELQVLAEAIMENDFHSNIVEKCHTFGILFILIEDFTASFLFNSHIDEFFGQINRQSKAPLLEVLESMSTKVTHLYKTKYLSQQEYLYFEQQRK